MATEILSCKKRSQSLVNQSLIKGILVVFQCRVIKDIAADNSSTIKSNVMGVGFSFLQTLRRSTSGDFGTSTAVITET